MNSSSRRNFTSQAGAGIGAGEATTPENIADHQGNHYAQIHNCSVSSVRFSILLGGVSPLGTSFNFGSAPVRSASVFGKIQIPSPRSPKIVGHHEIGTGRNLDGALFAVLYRHADCGPGGIPSHAAVLVSQTDHWRSMWQKTTVLRVG